jgi:hypothetical protein
MSFRFYVEEAIDVYDDDGSGIRQQTDYRWTALVGTLQEGTMHIGEKALLNTVGCETIHVLIKEIEVNRRLYTGTSICNDLVKIDSIAIFIRRPDEWRNEIGRGSIVLSRL